MAANQNMPPLPTRMLCRKLAATAVSTTGRALYRNASRRPPFPAVVAQPVLGRSPASQCWFSTSHGAARNSNEANSSNCYLAAEGERGETHANGATEGVDISNHSAKHDVNKSDPAPPACISAATKPKKSSPSAAATPVAITLDETELEERFIKGGGNGGQKINKTSNCVVLVHKPTGIQVRCQETRSLTDNRRIARKILKIKLDDHFNGALSKRNQKAEAERRKKQKKKQRAKKKYAANDTTVDSEDAKGGGEPAQA
ncbi:hypothetical protein AMAG_02974 [Allomyces macrogynus ATCC 38327]|uniref:Prokaryotic-type class I peptide chain release factors domain-containing protein n=1 Tax=Allomyces macrogynus (strain ATCC 38327) TaxID=578462 RepID=A0A0L0S4C0_ALLM3|nr:hypothetical protein AMAG_02974 [Allomyces macrogynus ATCC 38327]|eukprot:KNE57241.1 hypothetical protein AMAG_02974 [Allomyces macrogynus ATCC 38327]